jgi:catechol 2,3-dioxygenase-like lactoylglutathione lyase family enzyme
MIRGIHHIAMRAHDFDRMLAFYQDAFGFTPIAPVSEWKNSPMIDSIIGLKGSAARTVMLKAGTCFIELFEYFAPAPRDNPPLRPQDFGYTHFCVDVTDIDAEYKRLQALGMTFAHPAPVDAGDVKTVYGRDPEGNLIEIQQVADGHVLSLQGLTYVATQP